MIKDSFYLKKSRIFFLKTELDLLKKNRSTAAATKKIVFPTKRKHADIRTDISTYRIALLPKIGSSAAGGFATSWLHSFNSANSNLHSWHLKKTANIRVFTAH